MIYLDYPNKDLIAERHYRAVEDYVAHCTHGVIDNLYSDIRLVMKDLSEYRDANDFSWLRRFILADWECLSWWTLKFKDHLNFLFFKNLYSNRFAKDNKTFVDSAKTYNAYSMLKDINFHICPYCDEEYIDIFETENGERRTSDVDHFHPKGMDEYPALAMCFYNLVPSGKGCNQTMNISLIEANPYDPKIESWSRFYQNTPPGRNINTLKDEEIKIRLETKHGMSRNNDVLGIENRYNNRVEELKRLFELKIQLQRDNLKEKERFGITKDLICKIFGGPYPKERGKTIHQKLRSDLLGF